MTFITVAQGQLANHGARFGDAVIANHGMTGEQEANVKIYTRHGDSGKTRVLGSGRRYKDDVRVQAYGTVDEAGALLGVAMSMLEGSDEDIRQILLDVQQMLWDVGADLARVDNPKYPYQTPDDAAAHLEPLIDRYQNELPGISKFIVRGGTPAASLLHFSCTVVRRAERDVVRLQQFETIYPAALAYLNRLSDLLFVLARAVNYRAGFNEVNYLHSAQVFR